MKIPKNIKTLFISILFLNIISALTVSAESNNNYYYPKTDSLWHFRFISELSATALPKIVVEEEISYSPIIGFGMDIKSPYHISSSLGFYSNYFSNYGIASLKWHPINSKFSLSIGSKVAVWFGHLELDAVHLKSWGVLLYPTITVGYDFNKFLITADFESQHSNMHTFSEDDYLGTIKTFDAGFGAKLSLEQPFCGSSSVILSAKINYAKFYYQSWLSYSTLDEYLFYPEFIISYII